MITTCVPSPRVRWIPLQQSEWYGAPQGYRVMYRPQGCECEFSQDFVYDNTANSHQLLQLQEYTIYQVGGWGVEWLS